MTTISPTHDDESQEQSHEEEAEERRSPSGKVVYAAVMKEADEELSRTTSALFWSGLAAGLSMGFSLVGEAVLRRHLPDTDWRILVSKLGYGVGFLIVILGRQQLFTENTLTPMLPLLHHRNLRTLISVLRLWGLVLLANVAGTWAIGTVLASTSIFDARVVDAFVDISRRTIEG